MSATPDSTLADPQQIIADLQRELAEAKAERDEALEQQTATAEVLGVINSSPGDLAPVFDAMLERALRLGEAAFGTLRTFDGNLFHLAAARGASPALLDFQRKPLPPGPGTVRMLRGEDVIHTPDIIEGEAYKSGVEAQKALVELGGARSFLSIALRSKHALVGFISFYRQEVKPFTDKQIALLQNFAAQAVIAMENARLITETREALEQQTATSEVLGVINSSPGDLAPVFDAMLEKALHLCEGTFGHLWTYEGKSFRAAALRGAPQAYADFLAQGPVSPPPGTALAKIADGGGPVQFLDVRAEDAYRETPLVRFGAGRTIIGVPLRNDASLLGAITIYRQDVRAFTDKQIALLQNFAAQAVIAMENARLITETREALEQQTATAEVLQVINSSPGDLAPVFDAILEKARILCGAAHGSLSLYDGDRFRFVAINTGSQELADRIREGFSPSPSDFPYLKPLLDGAQFVQVPDLVEVGNPYGARTGLFMPLRKDDTLLGMISTIRLEIRPFSDKEIALVENFAAQAVIAIENARLLGELRQRTEEVAELNRGLEVRVAEQVEELGRVGRLKRFLAPQLAELIVSQGDEKILESHRREIVVVFCDLRGYTAFTETAEPEEVLDFLREYHGALGPLVAQFEGTLDQFSGDGIMVFFNDPVPIPDPAERAVEMAMSMREAAITLIATWRRRDRELGFGVGIAQGYATLGQIGFAERSGYTAIGTVCNLAARLCAEAKDGQILISGRVAAAVERRVPLEDLGSLALKGLSQPVSTFNVPLTHDPVAGSGGQTDEPCTPNAERIIQGRRPRSLPTTERPPK